MSEKYVVSTGMVIVDVIATELEKIADENEYVYCLESPTVLRQGGHPANIVIDLGKLGIPRERLASVSAVGKDMLGEFLKKSVEKYADVYYQQIDELPTAVDMILIVKGEEKRFHISPGALLKLTPEYVKSVIEKTKPKIFDIRPGYSGIDEHVEEILSSAKEAGSLVFLDVCRPFMRGEIKGWDYLIPAMEYVDVIHCNEYELLNVSGEGNVEGAINKLRRLGVKLFLITNGERGALAVSDNYRVKQDAYKVRAVDPTGAGDAFIAGFEYMMIEKNNLEPWNAEKEEVADMLRFAQACGAACVEHIGCTTGVTRERVFNIYKRG